jgi:hypothetical protein
MSRIARSSGRVRRRLVLSMRFSMLRIWLLRPLCMVIAIPRRSEPSLDPKRRALGLLWLSILMLLKCGRAVPLWHRISLMIRREKRNLLRSQVPRAAVGGPARLLSFRLSKL